MTLVLFRKYQTLARGWGLEAPLLLWERSFVRQHFNQMTSGIRRLEVVTDMNIQYAALHRFDEEKDFVQLLFRKT